MQLTNEEITKVFYLYYGQKVLKFSPTAPATQQLNNGMMSYWKPECRLYLTSLKDISDEHLVQIAKIAAFRPDHYTVDDADIRRHGNSIDVVFIDKIKEVINISFNGDVLLYQWVDANHKIIEERVYGQSQIVDKFRELGYALPYKGRSLFELGIAIEKKD